MIIDTLNNLEKYVSLNPLLADAVAFIKEHDLNKLEPGKYVIKEGELFVNVQDAKSKTPDTAVMEYHKKMIDIQIPLSADETYGYTPVEKLPETDFNEEKDVAKISDVIADSYIDCAPGMFAMFFPQDGHAPCISNYETLRKAVVKMKV